MKQQITINFSPNVLDETIKALKTQFNKEGIAYIEQKSNRIHKSGSSLSYLEMTIDVLPSLIGLISLLIKLSPVITVKIRIDNNREIIVTGNSPEEVTKKAALVQEKLNSGKNISIEIDE